MTWGWFFSNKFLGFTNIKFFFSPCFGTRSSQPSPGRYDHQWRHEACWCARRGFPTSTATDEIFVDRGFFVQHLWLNFWCLGQIMSNPILLLILRRVKILRFSLSKCSKNQVLLVNQWIECNSHRMFIITSCFFPSNLPLNQFPEPPCWPQFFCVCVCCLSKKMLSKYPHYAW